MGKGGFREGGPSSGESGRNKLSKDRDRGKEERRRQLDMGPVTIPAEARGSDEQNELWRADMDTIDTPLLDLHGMTVDEAGEEVVKFLEEQRRTEASYVKVMTGKGEGRLLGAVQGLLRRTKAFVAEFQPSRQAQHAGAAFIVKLKK